MWQWQNQWIFSLRITKPAFPVEGTGLKGAWPSPLPPWRVLVHWYRCTLKMGTHLAKTSLYLLCSRILFWPEIVNFVHIPFHKNSRQPYAFSRLSSHQTSAESCSMGRAVVRIPRVRGGGTHCSGQGVFGNVCRGGPHVCPNRNLVPMALLSEHNTDAIRHLLCPDCLRLTSTGHV